MSFFGKNIRKIRSIKKISQAAFAEIFGLSRASVGSYEEGRAEPKLEMIIQIANHFSISIDELINKELTVNDLYHFDLNTEPVFKQTTAAPAYTLNEMKLLMTTDLIDGDLDAAIKTSDQCVTFPVSSAGSFVALYVGEGQIAFKPENILNGDTLIIQTDELREDSRSGLWIIKQNDAIFISELVFLANDRLLLISRTQQPLYINKKDIQFMYPVQMVLSGTLKYISANDRIEKLELQVNELFKQF